MKKYLKYLIIFFLFLIWGLIINPLGLDEVWSYGFSNNIYNGLIPYKDFNMIVTPFSIYLLALPFYIFGSNMLVFHMALAFLLTVTCFFLFDTIGDNAVSIIALIILFCNYPSYNYFMLSLIFIIIWLEKKDKSDIIIGIILALAILTKQSVGICLIIPSLIHYRHNKKKIIKRLIGLIIPISIFIIYLIFTKSLYNFLDLCIYGMFDFGKRNNGLNTLGFVIFLVLFGISVYKMIRTKKLFYLYQLSFLSMAVPLFDMPHLLQCIIFMLYVYFLESDVKNNKNNKFVIILFFVLYTALLILQLNNYHINKINHFEYRNLEDNVILMTNDVNKFLKKYKRMDYVFLDNRGYYYKIINDDVIDDFDLINSGNFGYNGDIKMLEKLKSKNNTIFLVNRYEVKIKNQINKKMVYYIINHGKKIDTLKSYDVYILGG